MKIDFKKCEMYDGGEWVVIHNNFDTLFVKYQSRGLARFIDIINGKKKYGWVNSKGEPIGGLHNGTENFVNDFAQFYDEINGEDKYGWIDKYGIEYKTDLDNARKIQDLILNEFPVGSMKFYIFRKIYEN